MPNFPNFTLATRAPADGRVTNDKGWYWWDPAKELMASDYFIFPWNMVPGWATSGLPAGLGDMTSVYVVDELGAAICRPYWRYDYIPLTIWATRGTSAWEEITGAASGNTALYHMYDAGLTGLTGLSTKFGLPKNPSFAFFLGRYAPTESQPFGTTEPYTTISFGGIKVVIPFWRPAQIWMGDKFLQEIDLGLSRQATDGFQSATVGVFCLGGRILFTTDFMASFQVFEQGRRYKDDWLTFGAGPISVEHYGSRWVFALIPIDYPLLGWVRSRAVDRAYDPVNPIQGDEYGLTSGADGIINGEPAGNTILISPSEVGRNAQYLATLTPSTYVIAVGGIPTNYARFGITPELYATRVHCPPSVTSQATTGAPAILQGDILEIEVEYPEQLDISTCRLVLNNQDQRYNSVSSYAPVNLDAAPIDGGAVVDLFDGYVYSPQGSIQDKAYRTTVECVDQWQRLRDVFCTEADPCFAGWPVARAIWWMAAKCGVDFDWPTYDTKTRLDRSLYEQLWQPQVGSSVADFLKELAAYERYNLYFDGTTLKYLPFPLDTTIDWHFCFHSTPSDDGAPAGAKPVLHSVSTSVDPEKHRNVVRVVGQDQNGGRLVSVIRLMFNVLTKVGWEKEIVEINPDYNTQEKVNYVCSQIWNEVKQFPPLILEATVRFDPNIKRWQHVKTWGTGVTSNKLVWRIVYVKHSIKGADATTTIRGYYRRIDN